METYQTLSLIGCILGILLTIGLFIVMGVLIGTSDVLLNMSQTFSPNSTESQIQKQKQEANKSSVSPFLGGLAVAFFLYIAALVTTFVVRTKIKAVGIALLVIGVIAMFITNFWGVIPFALLLPAGIVAIRYKQQAKIPSI